MAHFYSGTLAQFCSGVDIIRREVLPHAPDAWIEDGKTVIGYEISVTRNFYKPQPLRPLADIEADIRALEEETEGLLEDVLTGGR